MYGIPGAQEVDPSASLASSDSDTSVLDAEARVQLYYVFVDQVLQHGDADAADRFLSADFTEHGSSGDGGRMEFLERLSAQQAQFPGAVWTIELLTSVGNLVLCHTTVAAPQLDNRVVELWESVVARIADGKIAEIWRLCDEAAFRPEERARTLPPLPSSSQNQC